jgi:CP family cyanate transporter-like MFS transporter
MLSKSFVVWLMLFMGGICLRTGISSVAPVLEAIQSSLQVSTTWLGMLTAIPVICMGVLSPLGHRLEQRFGMKKSMLMAFVILIAGLLLRLDSRSFGLLMLTAGCVGVADAIIRPLLSGFIKDKFPERVALAMSVYSASMGTGSALAAYGTPLLSQLATGSWRAGLAFWALPALIALLVWWFGPSEQPHAAQQAKNSFKNPVSRGITLTFTLFFGLQAGINYALLAWMPSFYIQQGFAEHAAGTLVAVLIVSQTLTSLLFSMITRQLRISHRAAAGVFSLITLLGIIALFSLQGVPWVAPLILGVGTGGLFPMALILPLDFTENRVQATRLSGITQSGGYLLGGAIPWLIGLAASTFGMTNGLKIFMGLCVLLILLMSLLIARAYRSQQVANSAR